MFNFRKIINRASYPFVLILLVLYASGCGGVKQLIEKDSPHNKYEKSLGQAGLLNSSLGRQWKAASEKALKDSLSIKLPYKESGYFFPNRAEAFSYSFESRRGEKLLISLERDTVHRIQIFIDLFRVEYKDRKKVLTRVAYAAESDNLFLDYEAKENQKLLLRLQPELMQSGRYTLSITAHPTLAFPVKNKNSKAMSGGFGDPRDGGKRRHEGVDIFAPKGNPVVAVSDGIITRRTDGGLGGKQIWMTNLHNQSFYYAHLDSQIVHAGEIVKEGEVLGLVGNTGNAIHSSPHLHFGIYMPGEGAVDPVPFINDIRKDPPEITVNMNTIGSWARVKTRRAVFRYSPVTKGDEIFQLEINTPLEVLAACANYYRVLLPDNSEGFIEAKNVESADGSKMASRLIKGKPVFDAPGPGGILVDNLQGNESLKELGEFNGYYLIRTNDYMGWISK